MERLKALSRGTRLVLVAAPLLFFSLFLTWQMLEVDFGPAGRADYPLDGWDAWGLLLALLVIAVVSLVVVVHMTDVKMADDVPWETLTFGLGNGVFVVTVVKNVTDVDSTWASYVYLLLARPRTARGRIRATRAQFNRLTRRTRSSPGPS
jgi:hypothetical protein